MKTLTTRPALGTNIRRTRKGMSAVYTVTALSPGGERVELTNDEFGTVNFKLEEINAKIESGEMEVLAVTGGIVDTFVATSETGLQAIANTDENNRVFVKYIYPFSTENEGDEKYLNAIGGLVTVVEGWAAAKGYIVWSY